MLDCFACAAFCFGVRRVPGNVHVQLLMQVICVDIYMQVRNKSCCGVFLFELEHADHQFLMCMRARDVPQCVSPSADCHTVQAISTLAIRIGLSFVTFIMYENTENIKNLDPGAA